MEQTMQLYLSKAKDLTTRFRSFSITQVSRSQNKQADALSKMAYVSFAYLTKKVLVEILPCKSIEGIEVMAVVEEEGNTWMTSIKDYLEKRNSPKRKGKGMTVKDKSKAICIVGRNLISEIHALRSPVGREKSNAVGILLVDNAHGRPNGDQSMSGVPSAQTHIASPKKKVKPITSPWPFYKWGIDICDLFPEAASKVKFLIVAIDYFTKWIEAKPIATIMGKHVIKFVRDNIVCRFSLPGEIILDNGKQFRADPFKTWCEKLSITQHFTSVKHPQSNGLVERANRSLGLLLNMDLLKETRELTTIAKEKHKMKMEWYYNLKVRITILKPEYLVYRSNEANKKEDSEKLGPNWEGPYESWKH
ncbi:reverse transcriptase domain-containing protein [Tanacetum coccineum]|uniref:Reverse transcriptase domain-containing protein n=1 Tax=Tanacetum coccineum TaxID=301880 RepID=A0ABQ5JBA5_9ASTR